MQVLVHWHAAVLSPSLSVLYVHVILNLNNLAFHLNPADQQLQFKRPTNAPVCVNIVTPSKCMQRTPLERVSVPTCTGQQLVLNCVQTSSHYERVYDTRSFKFQLTEPANFLFPPPHFCAPPSPPYFSDMTIPTQSLRAYKKSSTLNDAYTTFRCICFWKQPRGQVRRGTGGMR